MNTMHVDIEQLFALTRLSGTPDEKAALALEIPAILGFVADIQQALQHIDTTEVVGAHYNVLREDVPTHEGGMYTESLISAAPKRVHNHLAVEQVITGGKHA
jgi:Asp-tRNA(Asn)/Glu-tRNA(Gln) amidotransferase C subunit